MAEPEGVNRCASVLDCSVHNSVHDLLNRTVTEQSRDLADRESK
jgi:hypothetical protein